MRNKELLFLKGYEQTSIERNNIKKEEILVFPDLLITTELCGSQT